MQLQCRKLHIAIMIHVVNAMLVCKGRIWTIVLVHVLVATCKSRELKYLIHVMVTTHEAWDDNTVRHVKHQVSFSEVCR